MRSPQSLHINSMSLQQILREDHIACRTRSLTCQFSSLSLGMFLLTRLILDNLFDQEPQEDLKEVRDEVLPNGIDQA